MDILLVLGLLAGVLSVISYIPYVLDTLKGSTKPERATWFIWSVLTTILLFAQLAKGATHSIWLTAVQTFGPILIFLLSIRYGEGGFNKRDIAALLAAGAGIIAWYFTQEAAFALWITIAIDFSGALLTIIKAYEKPETETQATWLISAIAGGLAALAVGAWSPSLLAFPVYVLIVNSMVLIAIKLGIMEKVKARHSSHA